MIHDVDEALKALVRRDALNGSGAEVVLDAPTKDWAVRRNSPTVDLYLYDIREDIARRSVGRTEVRDDNGRITGRKPPARYFKLSYLLTAWTQRPEDEHRLLSSLLACFLGADRLDPELLEGTLAGLDEPITVTIAYPPPEDRSSADVWSALGGELKPSLDLVLSVPADAGRLVEAAPLVTEDLRLDVDRDGEPKRGRRRPAPLKPDDEASAVETVHGGDDEHPGRVFEMRSHPRP